MGFKRRDQIAITLDHLKTAQVYDHDSSITILFRDRDRMSQQVKAAMSFRFSSTPVKFVFQSLNETRVEWWTNGVSYNPYGPAIEIYSLTRYESHHHTENGSIGCDGAPAIVLHRYGDSYEERWINSRGEKHRTDGPSCISIEYKQDGATVQNYQETCNFICNIPDDAKILWMKRREIHWYVNDQLSQETGHWNHQTDFNVIEYFSSSSVLRMVKHSFIEERFVIWYNEEGKIHRTDGPGAVTLNKIHEVEKNNMTGKPSIEEWSSNWYYNGEMISNLTVINWAKKNNIKIRANEPCHDQPFFRDASGEVCFLTDLNAGRIR